MTNIKFSSIKNNLIARFGILILIFTVSVGFTYYTLNRSIHINNEINTVYAPSVKQLQDIKLILSNSKLLIANWIFVQTDSKNSDKIKLNNLMDKDYPKLKNDLTTLSVKWSQNDRKLLDTIFKRVDGLFEDYVKVKNTLSSFESYSDPMVVFEITPMMQEQGSISTKYTVTVTDLDKLAYRQIENANLASQNMTNLLSWFKIIMIFIAVGTISLGVFITVNTIGELVKPINQVKDVLINMGKGEIANEILKVSSNEIGEMSNALNFLSQGLKETAAYADKIGNGDLNSVYNPLSEKDLLGNALLEMGKKLKILNEEDKKRNWVSQGLASFADILRSSPDVAKLSDAIIGNLVKYIDANQGGIFLVKEEGNERILELTSCYAYNRKKFLQKKIYEGEGLLGQCLLEKETIFLTEVPDDYIQISSGMGGTNPKCIVIQPLIVNETMIGAIEIASFKLLQKFELEFLQRLGENIAGIISNVKVNERTVSLLDEARSAQESMRSQEEELRQNLEELTATQEEMFRKEQEYLQKISELELKAYQSVSL